MQYFFVASQRSKTQKLQNLDAKDRIFIANYKKLKPLQCLFLLCSNLTEPKTIKFEHKTQLLQQTAKRLTTSIRNSSYLLISPKERCQ